MSSTSSAPPELFEPDRHEPLSGGPFDAEVLRDTIARIVADTAARCDAERGWPIHPGDEVDLPGRDIHTHLYFGAAGVLWALDYLKRGGIDVPRRDWAAVAAGLAGRPPSNVDKVVGASYFVGSTGRDLVAWRLADGANGREWLDRLAEAIENHLESPTQELLAGTPGTALAASFLAEHTGQDRFVSLFRQSAERMLASWRFDPELDCDIWQQQFGTPTNILGAVHGLAGNVAVLLRGRTWLDDDVVDAIERRAIRALDRTAETTETLANWPTTAGLHKPDGPQRWVQICHGAPGVIVCLRDLSQRDAEFEQLLLRAGELVWQVGAVTKGSSLCHGTAGNGYALLALYRRTGDPIWLDRARAFAMTACVQQGNEAQSHGTGRYSLWTGGIGVAVYLLDCLREESAFPTLNVF